MKPGIENLRAKLDKIPGNGMLQKV